MKYRIIILSNQQFDSDLKTNKWQIAMELTKRGHEVVFIDPPLRFKALKGFLRKPSLNLRRLFFARDVKKTNLVVYKPANFFNFWPFSLLNTYVHSKEIKLLTEPSHGLETIIWVYHFDFPDLENFLSKIDYDLLIYDAVDEYTAFPEYYARKRVTPSFISWIQWIDDELKIRINQKGLQGPKWVLHREKWLAEKVNLMFVSAPGLVKKFKHWRKDVRYLPNAGAFELFDIPTKSLQEPADLKSIPHPRIGFSGAIDTYKNDIGLIEETAVAYPSYHFVMIGPEKLSDPDTDLRTLKSLSNIHFLGQKPYLSLPQYFSFFDAYFIPYNLNKYIVEGCFPTKYFDALAAGLPTVVTNLPAYEGYDIDGYVSKSDDDFIKNISLAIEENSHGRIEARKLLAKQNTWEGKVTKQLLYITDYFLEKDYDKKSDFGKA